MKKFIATELFTTTTVKTKLVSGTPRYVIPTPLDANDLLVEPETYTDKAGVEHVKGSPLTYYDNATGGNLPYPTGTRGLVVYNTNEMKFQGCPVFNKDGNRTVIIVNHVTSEHRSALEAKMTTYGNAFDLKTVQFRELETFMRGINLGNFYDSDTPYVRSAMSRDGKDVKEGEEAGFLSRKRDLKEAIYIAGPCEVLCPKAGLQPFGKDGGVLVLVAANDIAPNQIEDIKKAYTLEDGSKITDPAKQISHAVIS